MAECDPQPTLYPLNRSSPNLKHVITSRISSSKTFGLNPHRGFCPPYTRNIHPKHSNVYFTFSVLPSPTDEPVRRIFAFNTSYVTGRQYLRSAAQQKLIVPRCRRKTFGCRAECITGQSERSRADFRHFQASFEDLLLHVILDVSHVQRIEDFLIMRYINVRYTYLLTYLLTNIRRGSAQGSAFWGEKNNFKI